MDNFFKDCKTREEVERKMAPISGDYRERLEAIRKRERSKFTARVREYRDGDLICFYLDKGQETKVMARFYYYQPRAGRIWFYSYGSKLVGTASGKPDDYYSTGQGSSNGQPVDLFNVDVDAYGRIGWETMRRAKT